MADLQSKLVHVRTVLPVMDVVHLVREHYGDEPGLALAWATHDDDDDDGVPHCHVMIRFPGVRRWSWLREWLNARDPHNYSKPADSWRRGVRYLLHLDNPEKESVPRGNFDSWGVDSDELAMLLAGRSSLILPAIKEASALSPYDAFSFLVEKRGFRPSECTSALNLLQALERFKRIRSGMTQSIPVPEDYFERLDRLDDEALEESMYLDDRGWT